MPVSDQGLDPNRYTIIPRTLIFITRGDAVLLLRGDPDKEIWAERYNGVGGHIEAGEGALTAARRELKEETGLDGQNLRLVGTVTIDTGSEIGIGLFVFRGDYQGGNIQPSREGHLEWIPADKIEDYPLVEDLPTLIPRVLGMNKEDPPFSAHYSYNDEDRLVIQFTE